MKKKKSEIRKFMDLILNTQNRVGVLPFIGDKENNYIVDYSDLVKNIELDSLSFSKSLFYMLKDEEGGYSLMTEDYMIPVSVSDEYKEYRVKDLMSLIELSREEDIEMPDINLFKTAGKCSVNERVSDSFKTGVKLVDNLFEDINFKTTKLTGILELGEETSITIKDLIEKFVIIDDHLLVLNPSKIKKVKKDK